MTRLSDIIKQFETEIIHNQQGMESSVAKEKLIEYLKALEEYYISNGTSGALADGGHN